MKLSAPVYVLKAQAKELKRTENITMTEALARIAAQEGYNSWGLLMAKNKDLLPKTKKELLDFLNPGDLLLLAAKPQGGKTAFALGVLVEAFKEKRAGYFFSLESDWKQTLSRLADMDEHIGENQEYLKFDFSDEISADYIATSLPLGQIENVVIVIDYLQLLDQKRSNAPLQEQVEKLRAFAKKEKCIVVMISQVDRFADFSIGRAPQLTDIRLPNPLDLSLFNKVLFLNQDKMIFLKPET